MLRTLSLLVGATAILILAACSGPRGGGCCVGKEGCKGGGCAKPAAEAPAASAPAK